ncbi:MAG: HD domain-containing protein [Nitrospinae bacterium]|nr:HD domain-containing protein [Nitrospinota bacterium]
MKRDEITLDNVRQDTRVKIYIERANAHLEGIGYTEHGFRHANLVAEISFNILNRLGYQRRECAAASIAGFLHDMGNLLGRDHHWQAGAILAQDILINLGMELEDVAIIMNAIANHEEGIGEPTTPVAAALILADKADVHVSRVRNPDMKTFDIHDRVNYAVKHSFLRVDGDNKRISLELTIDTGVSQVMEYFEIFLSRMIISRRAAQFLTCTYELIVNDIKLL